MVSEKWKKVSCIIPAHNEGPRINSVLQAVHKHPMIHEVIVINDGSTDNTLEIAKTFEGITIINFEKNKGKAKGIKAGLDAAKQEYILLLDADLKNLSKKHITNLILPIQRRKAEISMSLRKNAPWISRKLGIDFITGERVFHRTLLQELENIEKIPGFGIEVLMNKKIIEKKMRIAIVHWPEVESPYPTKKAGFFKGSKRFAGMLMHIKKTNGVLPTLKQIGQMRKLRVEH